MTCLLKSLRGFPAVERPAPFAGALLRPAMEGFGDSCLTRRGIRVVLRHGRAEVGMKTETTVSTVPFWINGQHRASRRSPQGSVTDVATGPVVRAAPPWRSGGPRRRCKAPVSSCDSGTCSSRRRARSRPLSPRSTARRCVRRRLGATQARGGGLRHGHSAPTEGRACRALGHCGGFTQGEAVARRVRRDHIVQPSNHVPAADGPGSDAGLETVLGKTRRTEVWGVTETSASSEA